MAFMPSIDQSVKSQAIDGFVNAKMKVGRIGVDFPMRAWRHALITTLSIGTIRYDLDLTVARSLFGRTR